MRLSLAPPLMRRSTIQVRDGCHRGHLHRNPPLRSAIHSPELLL